jgi:hypothetical protein
MLPDSPLPKREQERRLRRARVRLVRSTRPEIRHGRCARPPAVLAPAGPRPRTYNAECADRRLQADQESQRQRFPTSASVVAADKLGTALGCRDGFAALPPGPRAHVVEYQGDEHGDDATPTDRGDNGQRHHWPRDRLRVGMTGQGVADREPRRHRETATSEAGAGCRSTAGHEVREAVCSTSLPNPRVAVRRQSHCSLRQLLHRALGSSDHHHWGHRGVDGAVREHLRQPALHPVAPSWPWLCPCPCSEATRHVRKHTFLKEPLEQYRTR